MAEGGVTLPLPYFLRRNMRVYLDTCSLQRPLDTRSQIRISLEAEAVTGLIGLCVDGLVELVSSDVLLFETRRNPWSERRAYALTVLETATDFIRTDRTIRNRAAQLHQQGLKPLDALHLASAEAANADFFCTVDDKLLARGKILAQPEIRVVSPIELIEEINQ